MSGRVGQGKQIGRTLGFPTANVAILPEFLPVQGVYGVYVYRGNRQYLGVMNIGYRPTINNGTDLSIEVHILDFQGDIYHQKMRIEFIDFLRPEEKFNSVDELILQMQKDKEDTIRVLK